jgi:hypothetical protein
MRGTKPLHNFPTLFFVSKTPGKNQFRTATARQKRGVKNDIGMTTLQDAEQRRH